MPVPTFVDYSIGTTPFGSNVANGVAVITATDLHQSSGALHDFSSAFSAYVVLPAGTYYLTLDSSFNFLAPGFSTVAYWALTGCHLQAMPCLARSTRTPERFSTRST